MEKKEAQALREKLVDEINAVEERRINGAPLTEAPLTTAENVLITAKQKKAAELDAIINKKG